jgi:hypothetical protein
VRHQLLLLAAFALLGFVMTAAAWSTLALGVRLVDGSSQDVLGNAGFTGDRAAMTANGRYVVFTSTASNLVPQDRNGRPLDPNASDIFRKDMRTGAVTLVSVTRAGKQARDGLENPAVSDDGRYVVFDSQGPSTGLARAALVMNAGAPSASWKTERLPPLDGGVVFLKDLVTGNLYVVSHNAADSAGREEWVGLEAAISANGRFIAFVGRDWRQTGAATGALYLRDRETGKLTREDVAQDGTPPRQAGVMWPSISSDGRFIAFCNFGSLGVGGGVGGIFLKDTRSGELTRISRYCETQTITRDGRFVLYRTRGGAALVRWDRETHKMLRLGIAGALSPTGRFFGGASSGGGNAYVQDLATGTRTAINLNGLVPAGVYTRAVPEALSTDGRHVLLATAGTTDGRDRAHLVLADR